jgi:nitrous oxide reductase accessory protein NosL
MSETLPDGSSERSDSTPHEHSGVCNHDHGQPSLRRRHVLGAVAATATAALAGCAGGGGGGEVPQPVTLTDEHTCDVCGMVIPKHPGPSSEIFYADQQPNGHENPARFDSTWEAFKFDFAREDWEREAFYVTDYSAVDYEIRTDEGQKLISTHPEKEAFVDAEAVTFVVASDVVGAMGKDLIAFSEESDAESFRDEHGGELATLEDVTPTMIGGLGM